MSNPNRQLNQLGSAFFEAEARRAQKTGEDLTALKRRLKNHFNGLMRSRPEDASRLILALEAGAPLTGPQGLRRELAAIDLGFFGEAYLPHYFTRLSPPFHKELDAIWQDNVLRRKNPLCEARAISLMDGCKCVTAAPRGHAKSTNFTFKDALHATLYGYKHYIILLSDSYAQAAGFLSAIADELTQNAAIQDDFGHLAGRVWREDVLITKTDIKLEAMGAGQKIRGRKHKNWRPDLLILDDVENDELVRTPEQRQKLYNWFTKAVSKAGDSYTDIVYIGTLLHYDALLAKLLKNPGYKGRTYKAVIHWSTSPLWDEWEKLYIDLDNPDHEAEADAFFRAHEREMLDGTDVLWPEKNSYYALMKTRIEDGAAAFNSELQNEPIDPDNCLFNAEWFDYYNPAEMDFGARAFVFYGAVDPSLGKSKKSDYSAIQILARDTRTGYKYSVQADITRRHPDQIIDDILEKAIWLEKTYGKRFEAFGCETVQFQWFLKEKLAQESARRGIYLPLVEIPQTADKTLRIQTLQPEIKNRYIKFDRRQMRLLQQLKDFPMAAHDDGPDALEMCNRLASRRHKRGWITVWGLDT